MPTIIEGKVAATVIEVFEVEPRDQRGLVSTLDRANVEIFQFLPGFVSASVHRGVDDRHVGTYAQWSSADAYAAALVHPKVQELTRILSSFPHPEPALYHVAAVCER